MRISESASLIRQEFIEHKAVSFSLMLFWGWEYALFWSGAFDPAGIAFPDGLMYDQIWLVSLTCNVLTLLLYFLRSIRRDLLAITKGAVLRGSCFMALGIVFIALEKVLTPDIGSVSYLAGSCLTGVGTAILMVYWGCLFSHMESRRVLIQMALAALGGAALCLATTAMRPWLIVAVMVVAPLLSGYLLHGAFKTEISGNLTEKLEGESILSKQTGSFLFTFSFLAAVIGISVGVIRCMTFVMSTNADNVYLFVIGVTLSGLLLLLTVNLYIEDSSFMLFFIAVAIIAAAFVVCALLSRSNQIVSLIHCIGFSFFNAIFWVFCASYSRQSKTVTRVFVGAILASQTGQIIGSLAGTSMLASWSANDTLGTYVSVSMVYLLLVAVVFVFIRLNKTNPFLKTSTYSEQIEICCSRIAIEKTLTQRETEIMVLLAKGRDRTYIAEKFMISVETVKTHIGHLYTKLGIHNRQQLLNLIEEHQAEYKVS